MQDFFHVNICKEMSNLRCFWSQDRARLVLQNHGEAFLMREAWDLGDSPRFPVAEWVWGSWLIICICFWYLGNILHVISRCLWSWEFEFHNLKPIVCFDLLSKFFTTLWFEPLSISRQNALLLMGKFKVYDSELNLRHIILQYLLVYVSYGHWSRLKILGLGTPVWT